MDDEYLKKFKERKKRCREWYKSPSKVKALRQSYASGFIGYTSKFWKN